MKLSCRVCIVGSGVAGGVVAQELLEAGVQDVLMIEAGAPTIMRDRRTWYDLVTRSRYPFEEHRYEPHAYTNTGPTAFELRRDLLRVRGGSTVHWDGWALRLKPEDFSLHANTGRGADWPISYDAIERFYALAEETLQVSGEASDKGHPPRSGPFPLPGHAPQEIDGPFIEAMGALGYSTQCMSIARNTRSTHGMAQCQLTGTCLYCPIGGRFTGDQLIDRLSERKGFRLLTQHAALALRFGSTRHADTLELLDHRTGERHIVEAESFVLCCGAIETPKLLLASANPSWPKGIGNHSDHVGRFLMNHAAGAVRGRMKRANPTRVLPELAFPTTMSRHFDDQTMQQGAGKFAITCVADDRDGELAMAMASGVPRDAIMKQLEAPARYVLIYGLEQPGITENRVQLGQGTDRLGMPTTELHYTMSHRATEEQAARSRCEEILVKMGCELAPPHDAPSLLSHAMGTCRMSRGAGDGVVDPELRVHETDNLYICGASVFPSAGVINPTLTLVALAHRLGRRLVEAASGTHR